MEATRRSQPGRKPRGRPTTAAAVVVVLIAAPALGTAAVLATATLVIQPAAFLTAGALVTAVTALAGTRRALRAQPAPRRTALTAVTTGALLLVGTIALLTPLVPPRTPRTPVDGAAFWQLDTGSRLAYIHLPATTPVRPVPVVVLHGGPGIPDTSANVAAFGPLTRLGFDVYFYDQLGAGRSARLADPAGYGMDRDVADLDAVRRTLGADTMILIGHSYGGALAGHYLATHPDHVQQMVLVSPGPLDPADTSASRATSGLDLPQKMAAYGAVLAPRALLGYALLQVNPAAAHDYLRDSEADARNDTVLTLAAPALHCAGASATATRPPIRGSGFYALQYPQSATAGPPDDPRPALTGLRTPTLIIKGSCDYLSWHSVSDYRDALSATTVVYLSGVGHDINEDRPVDVTDSVGAFLTGTPLPRPPYTTLSAPPDYQGPP